MKKPKLCLKPKTIKEWKKQADKTIKYWNYKNKQYERATK